MNVTTILYGTMTGNARDCAEKLESSLKCAGLASEVHDLAQYDPRRITAESTVLLVISTWGEGEPPDDAVGLYDYVKDLAAPSLANLRFAVFALGDTSYDDFCGCGKAFDRMFEELGARRLIGRVDNDVDYYDALDKWCSDVTRILRGSAPVAVQDAVNL